MAHCRPCRNLWFRPPGPSGPPGGLSFPALPHRRRQRDVSERELDRNPLGGCQRRPRMARSVSIDAPELLVGEYPTSSPRFLASTAPTCSTKMWVVLSPAMSASGRNDAGRALREVGATMTTDLGKNSSPRTTTAKRSPCCSWPILSDSRKRWTSPGARSASISSATASTSAAPPHGLRRQLPGQAPPSHLRRQLLAAMSVATFLGYWGVLTAEDSNATTTGTAAPTASCVPATKACGGQSRGSTGSLSRASTPKTHSWTL